MNKGALAGVTHPIVHGEIFIQRIEAGAGGLASFEFESIPQTFENLRIRWMGRSLTATDFEEVRLRVNNDSSAIYNTNKQFWFGNITRTPSTETGGTSFGAGVIPANTATAGRTGGGELLLTSYARPIFHKNVNGHNTASRGAAADDQFMYLIGGVWMSIVPITRLSLFPVGGSWATGSIATLYGLA